MNTFESLYQNLNKTRLAPWLNTLPEQIEQCLAKPHGDVPIWQNALSSLPINLENIIALDKGTITVTSAAPIAPSLKQAIHDALWQLRPWRKGPYSIHGTFIDCEWRSDWKWQRLINHISPLKDRYILDIGCGNGYHCWRMAAEQAKLVIGIDTSKLFWFQFQAIQHFIQHPSTHLLPIGIQHLPNHLPLFDTVFSMGVLYHRKSPFEHLQHLKSLLRAGGELVLETLVIDGDQHQVMVPKQRYAMMNNVWFLPSCLALEQWLERCGFTNIRVADINQTSTEEQRTTSWMPFQSLASFLDPSDPNRTIEGHPAPKRAIIIANTPD